MCTLRHLRNLWMPLLTTMVLGCFSYAGAQVRYKVTDLGTEGSDNLGCAMSVNNHGWTEIMAGQFAPLQNDSVPAKPLIGRVLIDVDGFKTDLGTLGGRSSWMMWGEINDSGQVVGFSETAVLDPNGEDVCGLGTHRTCSAFLWRDGHMSALPTLGGNNGQASAINNRGQIVGFAENGTVDSSCAANATNNRLQLPVLWENGKAQAKALPTGSDPGGNALWINDRGQAVGFTGSCAATNHAVVWENGSVNPLIDNGTGAEAFGNNEKGQIVGFVGSQDGSTLYGAFWQNDTLTTLSLLLPGDIGGIASGINNKGQVVGSNFDSKFNWSHAFIWQDGVMTDLNKLLPADSNLFAVMANKINERGQISGMAIVRSGPDEGNIHAFLATPVEPSTEKSIADVAPARPESNSPANSSQQLLQRLGLGRFQQ